MRLLFGILSILLLTGCTSTMVISSPESPEYTRMVEKVGKGTVTVKLNDGRRFSAEEARFTPDSLRYLDPQTRSEHAVPLRDVHEIVKPSSGRLSFLLAGVAVAGGIFTKVSPTECKTDGCVVEALSYEYAKLSKNVLFGILAGVGFLVGQAIEPNRKYVFRAPGTARTGDLR